MGAVELILNDYCAVEMFKVLLRCNLSIRLPCHHYLPGLFVTLFNTSITNRVEVVCIHRHTLGGLVGKELHARKDAALATQKQSEVCN